MTIRNRKELFRKMLISVPAAILLLALYMVIFGFSDQDAEQSGSLSMRFSESCVEWLNAISGGHWNESFIADLAEYFEHPVRKMAHFGEYMCVGILTYLVWFPWFNNRKRLYVLVVIWVFVSAALDEIHQYFVPGRWCSFADVCLDTAGGAFGLLLCLFVARMWRRKSLLKKTKQTRK